jgi:abortive infection bacteriophage resistance protein
MSRTPLPLVPFTKPWKPYGDQIAILAGRGLVLADPKAAESFLSHINYYRFSGYCLAFEQARHLFHPNVTFEQVRAAYEFDWGLRDLIADALEIIEIDFRTAVACHFGKTHGAFGHCDPAKFYGAFRHGEWRDSLREETRRSSELFVIHFQNTYAEFPDLPIWMATEVMSFGALSKMAHGMLRQDQKVIAQRYRVQPSDVLTNWMHHLVYIRNLCAHHSRLWDRIWTIKPTLPAAFAWKPPKLPGNNRLFVTLLVLSYLLKSCSSMAAFRASWRQRVEMHLRSPPSAPNAMEKMGLTVGWFGHPFWL